MMTIESLRWKQVVLSVSVSLFAFGWQASVQAQTAWLPAEGSLEVSPSVVYESFDEFYKGTEATSAENAGGGISLLGGGVGVQYALLADLAVDAWLGYSSATQGDESSAGLADSRLGLRYRLLDEFRSDGLLPTVSVRLGAVIPGTYEANKIYSPGDGVLGLEGSLLIGKHWAGLTLGVYGEVGYRYRTPYSEGDTEVDVPADLFASAGLYKSLLWDVSLSLGYRLQQGLDGPDIGGVPFPSVKEVAHNAEFGLGYTDAGSRYYGVYAGLVLAGRNTGKKTVIGFVVSSPFFGEDTL